MASAFSFSGAWERTRNSLSHNAPLILPVAAALLFLPQLILARFGGDLDPDSITQRDGASLVIVLLLVLAAALGQVIAQLHIAFLTLGLAGPTLGATLAAAIGLAPKGLAISLLQSMALVPALLLLSGEAMGQKLGGLLLLVAGFWLLLRLIYALPILVADRSGVMGSLQKSFDLTAGHVLRIGAAIGLLLFGFLILLVVIGSLSAILAHLVGGLTGESMREGWGVTRWLATLIETALAAGLSVILAAFVATMFAVTRDQRGA
ncbi:glycerophosphoryl diester phosphodiesterase membrane domain-containing protein [Thermaurantiacus sp.]